MHSPRFLRRGPTIARLLASAALVLATGASALDIELVRDVRPGTASSNPDLRRGTTLKGAAVLYFSAEVDEAGTRHLWRSDGTAAGTFELADIDVAAFRPMPDGGVYFIGTMPATGRTLFRSDGDAGYETAWDPAPGSDGSVSEDTLLAIDDTVWFVAVGPVSLWAAGWNVAAHRVSNYIYVPGSSAGASEVIHNFGSGGMPSLISGGISGMGRALLPYPADNPPLSSGVHLTAASGSVLCGKAFVQGQGAQLHCADPTRTWLQRIYPPELGASLQLRDNQKFAPLGNRLAFTLQSRLWVTDGTSAGTRSVAEALDPSNNQCLGTDRSDRLFFENAGQLVTATSAPGSERVLVPAGPLGLPFPCSDTPAVARWNGRFAVASGGLVVTDGTPPGTAAYWNPSGNVSIGVPIATLGGWLYVAGGRSDVGVELFRVRWPDLLQSSFEDDG